MQQGAEKISGVRPRQSTLFNFIFFETNVAHPHTIYSYSYSFLFQALKALACFRMNRIEECLPLCDEVLANKPTDLEVLTAMMHVLRALGRRK